MQYRTLGKTQLDVSTIGVGTWQLAGVWGKDFTQPEVDSIFSRAQALGINFVDTAECYGDHLSEQFIGNSLSGNREKWIIATKFGHNPSNDLDAENYHPEHVLAQLEASLRALKTDYIDIYQLHSADDQQFDNEELWTMLQKQVQAGKIRFLGNSIGWPNLPYQVEKSEQYGISVVQTIYNAINAAAAEHIFPIAERQDLGVIARVPLASGFLSGKYQPEHEFSDNDVRTMYPPKGVKRQIRAALTALEEKPEGMTSVCWANRWCLRSPRISTVIPGIKSLQQLEENAEAGLAL